MARYPGAEWRPLGPQKQPRMTARDIFCIHTMVGSLSGTDGYFKQNGYGGTESHWGTGADGTVYQWQDTDFTADANYRGSYRVLSVENADYGPGFPKWNTNDPSQVPAFTDAQIRALIDLGVWVCRTFDIPPVLIPDTKPGRRGIGYHAQGVPGNGLVPGGEVWSLARGKVCPGRLRIAQVKNVIVPGIAARLAGAPVPVPVTREWDEMATKQEIVDAVLKADVVPSPMFKDNPTVTVASALSYCMQWALAGRNAGQQAAKDAAEGLALTRAQAAKGAALSPAEIAKIQGAFAAALDAKIDSATVQLNVKPGA